MSPTTTRNPQRPAASGRFVRQLGSTRRAGPPARRTVSRPPMPFARRPPQKSAAGRTFERLGGLLPSSAAKTRSGQSGGGGKGKAGFAALAAVGALAFKNRGKVAALLDRARPRHDAQPPSVGVAPGTPADLTGGGDSAPEEPMGRPVSLPPDTKPSRRDPAKP